MNLREKAQTLLDQLPEELVPMAIQQLEEIKKYQEHSLQKNPKVLKEKNLSDNLSDPSSGHEELENKLKKLAEEAPGIEHVWEITKRLPSLSQVLSDERDNE
jgi:hypothetical protein